MENPDNVDSMKNALHSFRSYINKMIDKNLADIRSMNMTKYLKYGLGGVIVISGNVVFFTFLGPVWSGASGSAGAGMLMKSLRI